MLSQKCMWCLLRCSAGRFCKILWRCARIARRSRQPGEAVPSRNRRHFCKGSHRLGFCEQSTPAAACPAWTCQDAAPGAYRPGDMPRGSAGRAPPQPPPPPSHTSRRCAGGCRGTRTCEPTLTRAEHAKRHAQCASRVKQRSVKLWTMAPACLASLQCWQEHGISCHRGQPCSLPKLCALKRHRTKSCKQ